MVDGVWVVLKGVKMVVLRLTNVFFFFFLLTVCTFAVESCRFGV